MSESEFKPLRLWAAGVYRRTWGFRYRYKLEGKLVISKEVPPTLEDMSRGRFRPYYYSGKRAVIEVDEEYIPSFYDVLARCCELGLQVDMKPDGVYHIQHLGGSPRGFHKLLVVEIYNKGSSFRILQVCSQRKIVQLWLQEARLWKQ